MEMTKEFDKLEDKWVFYPVGDIDIYNSSDFKNEIVRTFKDNKRDILIDGEALNYMDSTGLGALIYILNEIKNDGFKIYLQNIKSSIIKILRITELDKLLIIRGENNEG